MERFEIIVGYVFRALSDDTDTPLHIRLMRDSGARSARERVARDLQGIRDLTTSLHRSKADGGQCSAGTLFVFHFQDRHRRKAVKKCLTGKYPGVVPSA